MAKAPKIPSFLQPVLWSVKVENLDLKQDKVYIINQILSCGTLPMIKWLFKTYSPTVINRVFLHRPVKDYTFSRFNFLKNYILGLRGQTLDANRYVKNLPRNIK